MKPQEIVELIRSEEFLWFMGERSWTATLARKILDKSFKTEELGFVLLQNIETKTLTEDDIKSFQQFYLFNKEAQWHFICNPDKQDDYYSWKSGCNCQNNYQDMEPEFIRNTEGGTMQTFTFAQSLGALPKIPGITIKQCPICSEWRFYVT
jgi:hypothetical protein